MSDVLSPSLPGTDPLEAYFNGNENAAERFIFLENILQRYSGQLINKKIATGAGNIIETFDNGSPSPEPGSIFDPNEFSKRPTFGHFEEFKELFGAKILAFITEFGFSPLWLVGIDHMLSAAYFAFQQADTLEEALSVFFHDLGNIVTPGDKGIQELITKELLGKIIEDPEIVERLVGIDMYGIADRLRVDANGDIEQAQTDFNNKYTEDEDGIKAFCNDFGIDQEAFWSTAFISYCDNFLKRGLGESDLLNYEKLTTRAAKVMEGIPGSFEQGTAEWYRQLNPLKSLIDGFLMRAYARRLGNSENGIEDVRNSTTEPYSYFGVSMIIECIPENVENVIQGFGDIIDNYGFKLGKNKAELFSPDIVNNALTINDFNNLNPNSVYLLVNENRIEGSGSGLPHKFDSLVTSVIQKNKKDEKEQQGAVVHLVVTYGEETSRLVSFGI